ncbi:hypothetical protein ACFVFI_31345 [Streptomyces sp. NPDC057705]|uniref:hypothetical protein n=1 Tax=Streptomyces sp. NPDC057705 TaxID=3346222 RepID=UPI0036C7B0F0
MAWFFSWADLGKTVPEKVVIENRGLSPIYNASLDGSENGEVKQTYLPGDVPSCTRYTIKIAGFANSGAVRTDLDFVLSFTDFRGNNWTLNSDRTIGRHSEFERLSPEAQSKVAEVPILLGGVYEQEDLEACG